MRFRPILLLLSIEYLFYSPTLVKGSSYFIPRVRRGAPLDPNCQCSQWEYVDQCGEDCRQFRWRNCEPEGCAVEDETVPCFSVEWDEWGSCDPATCTRARSQACMCLMRKVSPDICMMMNLETETESCNTDIEEGEWSSCDRFCARSRVNTCTCADPRTRTRVTVADELCGLDATQKEVTENCETRVVNDPWTDCDADCEQKRDSECMCDDPRGDSFQVGNSLCSVPEGFSETRSCATEWGDWIHKEECPATLPVGKCHVFGSRYRNCYCVNEDDQRLFAVRHDKCGIEPFKGSFRCAISEKCSCMVVPGTPAICRPTCNEEDEGISRGSPPTCECTPEWYQGSCDEDQMEPDWKICRVQPSQWNDWTQWAPAQCDENCQQTRRRTCGCFDGRKQHLSDLSKCPGESEETRDCTTEWGDWMRKPCPKQGKGDCVVKTTEFRQCGCSLNPALRNIGNDKCEGDLYIREVRDCPLDPYGECKCMWFDGISSTCNPDRKECGVTYTIVTTPFCRCTPFWYEGTCDESLKPDILEAEECPPTIPFEWEDWLPWSECDRFTCMRKRYRKCTCRDDEFHLQNKCEGDNFETELCDTEWGPWIGGCSASDPTCSITTEVATRDCRCSVNSGLQWEGEDAQERCGKLGGSTTMEEVCDAKPYEVTSWGEWSECDNTCSQRRNRDCGCTDDVDGQQFDKSKCPDGTNYEMEESCDKNWSEWSDPHCGEATCVMKTRPRFRMCMCENGVMLDNSECGKLFEIAVKCPFIPPDDPRCRDCTCTDWECDAECDNTYTRKCGPTPGCDVEARYTKENCCMDKPPCTCTEWQCKESCDATMIRTCEDGCDIEEKPIAQPCCVPAEPCQCTEWQCKDTCDATMIRVCVDGCDIEEKEIAEPCCDVNSCQCSEWGCKESCDKTMIRECTPGCQIREEKPILEPCCTTSTSPSCQCSDWQCKDTCDATMVRSCADGCDVEEKEIAESCCDADSCQCSEWRCKDSCDATIIRDCTPGCDIREEKPIAEPCCDLEPEEECYCGKWVGVSCVQEETGCIQEEWRVCSPPHCDDQVQNVTSTCCDNDQSVIPEDCSACGRWIDIGPCRDDQQGTHQWRSTRNCDKTACEEFRCVPDGKHCKEEKCGEWYDIGDCDAQGAEGVHQWRDTEECFCEPYRCTSANAEKAEDLKMCTCSEWKDMSGCDNNCINTVSRSCDPPSCDEEWRIQSGFCCI